MSKLPEEFINYCYRWRSNWVKSLFDGTFEMDRNKMMLDITRLLPTVCIAQKDAAGSIVTNGKIMGVGFLLKPKYMREAADAFSEFIMEEGIDAQSALKAGGYDRFGSARGMPKEWQIRALELLKKYLFFDKDEANEKLDFEKLSTIEMGTEFPGKAAHMSTFVKENKKATLVYFTPPVISFEVRAEIEIQTSGDYFDFVHGVHDVYHGENPDLVDKPVYIFNIQEVYDNSATKKGFGQKLT